ncbi:hypothetical protein AAG570_002837 [Ranatra chinensis]|uniref:Small ribosomal subunit protein mS26 n=1 Tax=Ranatra chinensis TaxID=642074 RepID=A0ABD0Y4Z7_9HEMI
MLRSVSVFLESGLCGKPTEFNNNVCCFFNQQCVRWRRKPRWLPVAKTKVFRVPVKNHAPPEEQKELKRLHDNYKTAMKSIRYYFTQRAVKLATGPEVVAEHKRLEEEDHSNCIRLNDEWNAEVALLREERIMREKEAKHEAILKAVEDHKRQMEERRLKVEEFIRLEKEKSKTYITPQNIDAAIERALSNEVDYNFSIDVQGNIYKGRRAKPETKKEPLNEQKYEAQACD